MFVKIIGVISLLVAGFLSYIAFQPSEFKISRELLIQAPPDVIFPYINNSKKAGEWMPWQESDPQLVMNYSGPEEGIGSFSSWDSPGKMGTGQAEVVASTLNQSVQTKLTYTKPMTMSQLAEISLTQKDGGTLVRWSVTGQNSFVGRVFCTFMNMDKMVGSEFEKGLNKLKLIIEKRP